MIEIKKQLVNRFASKSHNTTFIDSNIIEHTFLHM